MWLCRIKIKQFEKTYSSSSIGTSTTIIISNARIVRVSKLRVAITLGYVCESAKGVTEVGKNTIVYLADPSVFEREDKSIVPPGVSHTQLGFPAGGMHGS